MLDNVQIRTWQVADNSQPGGQAIKPWPDVWKIIYFKLNSLEEIFGTFLKRTAKEENYAKHGISLFIFSPFSIQGIAKQNNTWHHRAQAYV